MTSFRISYDPIYEVDYSDQLFPKIVRRPRPSTLGIHESADGLMTFDMAKQELLKAIREQRDHWAGMLRKAKELKLEDI